MNEKYDKINKLLLGAAGRMIVLARNEYPEIKEAHQMVLDASVLFDEGAEEVEELEYRINSLEK